MTPIESLYSAIYDKSGKEDVKRGIFENAHNTFLILNPELYDIYRRSLCQRVITSGLAEYSHGFPSYARYVELELMFSIIHRIEEIKPSEHQYTSNLKATIKQRFPLHSSSLCKLIDYLTNQFGDDEIIQHLQGIEIEGIDSIIRKIESKFLLGPNQKNYEEIKSFHRKEQETLTNLIVCLNHIPSSRIRYRDPRLANQVKYFFILLSLKPFCFPLCSLSQSDYDRIKGTVNRFGTDRLKTIFERDLQHAITLPFTSAMMSDLKKLLIQRDFSDLVKKLTHQDRFFEKDTRNVKEITREFHRLSTEFRSFIQDRLKCQFLPHIRYEPKLFIDEELMSDERAAEVYKELGGDAEDLGFEPDRFTIHSKVYAMYIKRFLDCSLAKLRVMAQNRNYHSALTYSQEVRKQLLVLLFPKDTTKNFTADVFTQRNAQQDIFQLIPGLAGDLQKKMKDLKIELDAEFMRLTSFEANSTYDKRFGYLQEVEEAEGDVSSRIIRGLVNYLKDARVGLDLTLEDLFKHINQDGKDKLNKEAILEALKALTLNKRDQRFVDSCSALCSYFQDYGRLDLTIIKFLLFRNQMRADLRQEDKLRVVASLTYPPQVVAEVLFDELLTTFYNRSTGIVDLRSFATNYFCTSDQAVKDVIIAFFANSCSGFFDDRKIPNYPGHEEFNLRRLSAFVYFINRIVVEIKKLKEQTIQNPDAIYFLQLFLKDIFFSFIITKDWNVQKMNALLELLVICPYFRQSLHKFSSKVATGRIQSLDFSKVKESLRKLNEEIDNLAEKEKLFSDFIQLGLYPVRGYRKYLDDLAEIFGFYDPELADLYRKNGIEPSHQGRGVKRKASSPAGEDDEASTTDESLVTSQMDVEPDEGSFGTASSDTQAAQRERQPQGLFFGMQSAAADDEEDQTLINRKRQRGTVSL